MTNEHNAYFFEKNKKNEQFLFRFAKVTLLLFRRRTFVG